MYFGVHRYVEETVTDEFCEKVKLYTWYYCEKFMKNNCICFGIEKK